MTLFLYQTWPDKRLKIRRKRLKKLNLTLSSEVLDQVWVRVAEYGFTTYSKPN